LKIPGINQAGQILVHGELSTFDQQYFAENGFELPDSGVWFDDAGSGLSLVARSGQRPPGTAPNVRYRFVDGVLNDQGQIALGGVMTGPGVDALNETAIWSNRGGSMALVARAGQFAAGIPGGFRYYGFRNLQLNNSGRIAFTGDLTDSTSISGYAIFTDVAGSFAPVARSYTQAAGLPDGVNYGWLGGSLWFSDAGHVAYAAALEGPGVDANDFGIWSTAGANGRLLVAANQPAPDLPSGYTYEAIACCLTADRAGNFAVGGVLTGPGIHAGNDEAVWYQRAGSTPKLLFRQGDQAPDMPAGVVFGDVPNPSPITFRDMSLSDSGQMAFGGGLVGSGISSANDFALFVGEPSTGFEIVAREGGLAPDLTANSRFTTLSTPIVNRAGQVAFEAGVNNSFLGHIFATDRQGNLRLIARAGSQIDVDDGPGVDLRTISQVFFESDGHVGVEDLKGFNDRGQLAFYALFADGSSGVFVSNLVAVPEPASAWSCTIAISYVLMARFGRGRRKSAV
jgi:hypothetical protein